MKTRSIKSKAWRWIALGMLGGAMIFGKSGLSKENGAGYAQPIQLEQSAFYYVPKISSAEVKSSFSVGYSAGFEIGESGAEAVLGYRSCNYENVVLVRADTLEKRNLFNENAQIESFFALNPKNLKDHPELSKLLFVVSRVKADAPRRLFLANLDGTDLKPLTPETMDVASVRFDLKRARAFVLLRDPAHSDVTHPEMIDLKTRSHSVSLLQ